MRSIRLSLVVYFLVLEAVALALASWQVYHTAERSMAAQQEAGRRLLLAKHDEQVNEAKARLDGELLRQARTVANFAEGQYQRRNVEPTQLLPLGLLTAADSPHGHLLMPVWYASGTRSRLNTQLSFRLAFEVSLDEAILPHDAERLGVQYIQINAERGAAWRSRSLGELVLPFDPARLSGTQAADEVFDEVDLPNDLIGRRVQFKTSIHRISVPRGRPFALPSSTTADRLEGFAPWIVVHCACETTDRDVQIARLHSELDEKLSNLLAMAEDSLAALASRLTAIAAVTFAVTAVGGFSLVSVGLLPLRRLTRAVSRVSPRDFRLPLERGRLPFELEPIAARLRETLDGLRHAFEREKQAVADISHELRTPVAALLATLDVTLRKPRTVEEYRRAVVEARTVGGHLRQLVERLLALARLDAGVARAVATTVDVQELVTGCTALIRPIAAEKGLTLTAEGPAALSWSTDADKLREILVNLLHNAVQYNRPGGTVHVRYGAVDGRLELAITDTGVGIPAEQHAHIFERFFRADPSREEPAMHAGLGLSIVRGYADLLGGDISLTSTVGQGTTFRLRLPPLPGPAAGREAA